MRHKRLVSTPRYVTRQQGGEKTDPAAKGLLNAHRGVDPGDSILDAVCAEDVRGSIAVLGPFSPGDAELAACCTFG